MQKTRKFHASKHGGSRGVKKWPISAFEKSVIFCLKMGYRFFGDIFGPPDFLQFLKIFLQFFYRVVAIGNLQSFFGSQDPQKPCTLDIRVFGGQIFKLLLFCYGLVNFSCQFFETQNFQFWILDLGFLKNSGDPPPEIFSIARSGFSDSGHPPTRARIYSMYTILCANPYLYTCARKEKRLHVLTQ